MALLVGPTSHTTNGAQIRLVGVITYATNHNTSEVVRRLSRSGVTSDGLRIVLETDGPYMVPSNIYGSIPELRGAAGGNNGRLPLCHSAMLPWTAEFVSDVINRDHAQMDQGDAQSPCDVNTILRVSAENAAKVYGL